MAHRAMDRAVLSVHAASGIFNLQCVSMMPVQDLNGFVSLSANTVFRVVYNKLWDLLHLSVVCSS